MQTHLLIRTIHGPLSSHLNMIPANPAILRDLNTARAPLRGAEQVCVRSHASGSRHSSLA